MEKKKLSSKQILSIVISSIVGLSHIAVIVAVALSFKYYSIYPSLFVSVVAIVACILLMIDIIFFIAYNHKDFALKVITCVMAVLLLLSGTVGSIYLGRINKTVNKVLSGDEKYESVSGVFVCRYNEETKTGHKYESLKELSNVKVAVVAESSEGVTSLGLKELDSAGVKYEKIECGTMVETFMNLIQGKCDVAILTNGYRAIFERDENVDYSDYLKDAYDFQSFEGKVKSSTKASNKNISIEPFNILLIGWSRVELGSKIGLADAIILATVNPQTYTVSMTSIARDSYVPVSCYGGTYDKINSGRSTSRACFIETVEDLIDEKIDFYMEADYDAIVNIVEAIGGVWIDNPVTFTLDGITVPEGHILANGYQALEFVRERHSMPNGDFDRQQHQKEVIIQIAKTLVESRDVNLALDAFEAAGEYLNTNLSLNQLTTMFNMILNTKNFTGLETFGLIDFHTLRITGYASWHYNESYGLPLWIYKLYNGSVKECLDHMHLILGDNVNTSDQEYSFEFSIQEPYIRPSFVSASFDEDEVHEVLPPFYPALTSMTYEDAMKWAEENNVEFEVKCITPDDLNYDPELDGMIIDQSVSYGRLVSENPKCTITVMGYASSVYIPSFVGKDVKEAKEWAHANDHHYEKVYGKPYEDEEDYEIIYEQKYDEDTDTLIVYCYGEPIEITVKVYDNNTDRGSVSGGGDVALYQKVTIKASAKEGYVFDCWVDSNNTKISSDAKYEFEASSSKTYYAKFKKDVSKYVSVDYASGSSSTQGTISKKVNSDDTVSLVATANSGYEFAGWYSSSSASSQLSSNSTYTISAPSSKTTYYAKFKECTHSDYSTTITKEANCKEKGEKTFTCKKCGHSWTEEIPIDSNNHVYDNGVVTTEPTCVNEGVITYTCSKCNNTYTEVIYALGHDWENGTVTKEASCKETGEMTCGRENCTETKTIDMTEHTWDGDICSVCGVSKTN